MERQLAEMSKEQLILIIGGQEALINLMCNKIEEQESEIHKLEEEKNDINKDKKIIELQHQLQTEKLKAVRKDLRTSKSEIKEWKQKLGVVEANLKGFEDVLEESVEASNLIRRGEKEEPSVLQEVYYENIIAFQNELYQDNSSVIEKYAINQFLNQLLVTIHKVKELTTTNQLIGNPKEELEIYLPYVCESKLALA